MLSADGKDVIYPIWDDSCKRELMVRVPVDGGERVELAAGTNPAQDLVLQGITADGEYIIYTGYDHTGTALYSTPMMHRRPSQLLPLPEREPSDTSWQLQFSPVGNQSSSGLATMISETSGLGLHFCAWGRSHTVRRRKPVRAPSK